MSKTTPTCGKCDDGWICERGTLICHGRTISAPDPQCHAMLPPALSESSRAQ